MNKEKDKLIPEKKASDQASDQALRLKALEYAYMPGLGVDLDQVEKIYHFILTGELICKK